MSSPDAPPPLPPAAETPPPPPNGCLTALMVLVGIVLLLPGLCAVIFGAGALFSGDYDTGYLPFVLFGLLVGFGGIMLIRVGIRGPRR
jgi:hypothetical protein